MSGVSDDFERGYEAGAQLASWYRELLQRVVAVQVARQLMPVHLRLLRRFSAYCTEHPFARTRAGWFVRDFAHFWRRGKSVFEALDDARGAACWRAWGK